MAAIAAITTWDLTVPATDTVSTIGNHATITVPAESSSSFLPYPLWHGTTSNLATVIEREGLKPNPADQWRIAIKRDSFLAAIFDIPERYKPYEMDARDVIFLSTSREKSLWFARAKARYLRAQPGAEFRPAGTQTWWKEPDAPQIAQVHGVLFKVRLPLSFIQFMGRDERADHSFTFRGSIPPEFLKRVPLEVPAHAVAGGAK